MLEIETIDANWGTEEGRDLLSRIIIGAKETLFSILIIVCLRYVLAIPNQLFSRLPTVFITIVVINIPFIIFSDIRIMWIILLIAIIEVGRVGQIIYSHLDSNSHAAFIQSGIALGLTNAELFRKYYLPLLVPQLIVNFVIDLSRTMLLLGQLGLFLIFIFQQWYMYERMLMELKITSNAWPALLKNIIYEIRQSPWIPFWVTLAITYAIVSFNILGDGLWKFYLRKQQS